jgi:hypothetical protein
MSRRWLPGIGEAQNYVHAIPLPERDQKRLHRAAGRKKRVGGLRPRAPSIRERAIGLVREKGTATTQELQAVGVHRCYLTPMCEEGLLTRVAHGRYCLSAPVGRPPLVGGS